jgi:NAD(P)-dependent dehydrogenase (short-subunit alcohol dehydrogenase family)
MDLSLSGKRAFISGSTKGIGRAIALALQGEGAEVIINGRTQKSVDAALKGFAPGTKGIAADVGTAAGTQDALAQLEKTGAVDILVNNAGIFEPKPFPDIPDEDWMKTFEVNVMSGVRLTRALLPGMIKRNWGRVIFISSESAINVPAEMVHYGMSKMAQLAVSRGAAEYTKGTRVTVNTVMPGPTRSDGVNDFLESVGRQNNLTPAEMEEEFFSMARPSSLLRRFATVEEVADFVAFVASPRAAAINGAALRVDGGVVKSAV